MYYLQEKSVRTFIPGMAQRAKPPLGDACIPYPCFYQFPSLPSDPASCQCILEGRGRVPARPSLGGCIREMNQQMKRSSLKSVKTNMLKAYSFTF